MQDLDAIISASKPGDTIQLQDGIYTTAGSDAYPSPSGAVILAGITLVGSGRSRTLIKLRHPGDQKQRVAIYGVGDNITIRDLSVDCGPLPSAGWQFKNCGIVLTGSNATVSNCDVVRAFGLIASDNEGFGIKLSGADASVGNCHLSWMLGDYVTAIAMGGLDPAIQFCNVILPQRPAVITPGYFMTGLNLAGVTGGLVRFNSVHGGVNGIYTDTGDVVGTTFDSNVLNGQSFGIHMNGQSVAGVAQRTIGSLVFSANQIITDQSWNDYASVILDNTCNPYSPTGVANNVRIQNLVFRGNIARSVDGAPLTFLNMATQAAAGSTTAGIGNISFEGNDVPASATWRNMNNAATGVSVTVPAAIKWLTS